MQPGAQTCKSGASCDIYMRPNKKEKSTSSEWPIVGRDEEVSDAAPAINQSVTNRDDRKENPLVFALSQ